MSATTTSSAGTSAAARSPLISWLAVISVMLGIFSIVTTEILPIGLLTSIAAIAAPIATVATARLDRRLMLCVPVCSQAWFVKSFPQGTEAASVLFTSSFQATISIGALLGGVVVDATSPSTVMELGGVMAALMALAVWTLSRAGQPD